MSVYQGLQLDPAILKQYIRKSQSAGEKRYYYAIMAARSVLIVAFAILFIGGLSQIFGQENTPMAVVLFCWMLAVRFVNFEYCIRDSLVSLGVMLSILLLAPTLALMAPPMLLFVLHGVAFFALLTLTSQRPELGNAGLCGFSYVYLTGNPVQGEVLLQRAGLALVGYLICALILVKKHRGAHREVRFHHVVRRFSLTSLTHLWQVRMALGVSLVLTLGSVLQVQRFIWMGFACASLLSQYPYSPDTRTRVWQRIVGVLAGSEAYFVLYQLLPSGLHPMMGPLGGLCLGFCTDYRYKTAMNCFGALMMGTAIYGVQDAVVLRIVDTILGVLLGMVFAWVFHHLVTVRVLPEQERKTA